MPKFTRAVIQPHAILAALAHQAIPGAKQAPGPPMVEACATHAAFEARCPTLPEDVRTTRIRLSGRRETTKEPASRTQTQIVSARARRCLEEKPVPMLVCVLDGHAAWAVSDYVTHCGPTALPLGQPGSSERPTVPPPPATTPARDHTRPVIHPM